MKKVKNKSNDPDMLEEYDFSNGIRGKYAWQFQKGCIGVVLDPAITDVFPDSESVNQALRPLAEIIRRQTTKA